MNDRPRILVIHGPNLNFLGTREPETYGTTTLADINETLQRTGDSWGVNVDTFQSNHEGMIVEAIQAIAASHQGLIINPAAYTHTSVAIRDALLLLKIPIVEVHLSNVHQREPFRHKSLISDVCTGQIVGLGSMGYLLALEFIVKTIRKQPASA
ncbi:MAG: type II 3-dehydroquinate dehydratase [Thermodesulfobacteriota bacterium]